MRGETSAEMPQESQSSFQSTPLIRGETVRSANMDLTREFQSTPLVRGETLLFRLDGGRHQISIHSPHARGDAAALDRQNGQASISIHSPHARGDFFIRANALAADISIHSPHSRGDESHRRCRQDRTTFQSTPLMRGETGTAGSYCPSDRNFNPLPSCEGRL